MRKTKFIALVIFLVWLLAGCGDSFTHGDATWKMVAEVFLISSPYRLDGENIDVVAIIWSELESPTGYWFTISDFLRFGFGKQNLSGIWNGYPVSMVPVFLREKVLCKKIRMQYQIIRNDGIPLIEIKGIKIL
ncbi:MAG: hypothetical protein A2174_03210 [Candidatus Portnoybacteria bacterium RBG_13_41_18]|uniref:Lipoprotein n=1 Tax=Candidatus Portnoybacteria bacterium RBG_13_41_18 TaxID=1801991 RepID=A0A1G2F5R5_9BACT|nr:MAG: hypothetical protein A2174_03210 [Candidatus Portnoybacteria bacterium RBG_13_41_18]